MKIPSRANFIKNKMNLRSDLGVSSISLEFINNLFRLQSIHVLDGKVTIEETPSYYRAIRNFKALKVIQKARLELILYRKC